MGSGVSGICLKDQGNVVGRLVIGIMRIVVLNPKPQTVEFVAFKVQSGTYFN